MIAFIDEHRSRFGVEPICRVLREHDCGIAPNTYWVAKQRPPSARALRDVELVAEVHRVFVENLFVYGADKIWTQLNREEIRVARCAVERLMRAEGLCGARRGRAFTITTQGDDGLHRPADLVDGKFRAPAPDRLWVADLAYVKTHSGWVYVAFIIDVYSRMIVGWQASRSLRSDLAIDALDMVVWNLKRAGRYLDQLIHHSDRGVQYLSIRYSERLADNDIVASVGSKRDSYDNAMTKSFNGLYRWELIYSQGLWRGPDHIEFATTTYVDWFNQRGLHSEITSDATCTIPAEAETDYYRQKQPAEKAVT